MRCVWWIQFYVLLYILSDGFFFFFILQFFCLNKPSSSVLNNLFFWIFKFLHSGIFRFPPPRLWFSRDDMLLKLFCFVSFFSMCHKWLVKFENITRFVQGNFFSRLNEWVGGGGEGEEGLLGWGKGPKRERPNNEILKRKQASNTSFS